MDNIIKIIEDYFNELLPDAKCELIYNKDYEFLIAVMLSAQCTDKKVNSVTPILFIKYPTIDSLKNANINDIENIIKPLGLFKNKAKNIIEIANLLADEFNYILPSNKEDLIKFPGVGNKTANVVRAEIFKIPEFPVDTHVKRVSLRLDLTKSEDVDTIEKDLKRIFKKENWIKLHHQFIHFGRYYCKAINPNCKNCKLTKICKYSAKP